MSRHDVVKRHDFRSAVKSKEKSSSMKSVRFDGIYNGKEAEVGHGGGGVSIYIYTHIYIHIYIYIYVYVCVCLFSLGLLLGVAGFKALVRCLAFFPEFSVMTRLKGGDESPCRVLGMKSVKC